MKVLVKWLKSPRQKYGIPRSRGVSSYIDRALAKKILKESPGFLIILEEEVKEKPIQVLDTMVKKARKRPVKREKKN